MQLVYFETSENCRIVEYEFTQRHITHMQRFCERRKQNKTIHNIYKIKGNI